MGGLDVGVVLAAFQVRLLDTGTDLGVVFVGSGFDHHRGHEDAAVGVVTGAVPGELVGRSWVERAVVGVGVVRVGPGQADGRLNNAAAHYARGVGAAAVGGGCGARTTGGSPAI